MSVSSLVAGTLVENGRLHEVSCFIFRNARVASVEQNLRSLLLARRNQRLDSRLALRRDHRAHLHAFVEAIAHAQRRSRLGNRIAKSLLRFADRHRDGNRQAALSGAAKGAVADDLRGHLHVGVGQNDDVVLRAALALRALPVLTGARIDVPRDRRGTDKTDGANLGMIEQRVDDVLAAVHQVQTPFGSPMFSISLERPPHGERHALRWLQDKSISGGDGVGQKPERNHPGEIKRNDRGDHAQRLPDHHFVDAAGHVFEVVALHHHGNAAGNFDVFDGAAQLGFGFGKRLAVFLSEDAASSSMCSSRRCFSLNSG